MLKTGKTLNAVICVILYFSKAAKAQCQPVPWSASFNDNQRDPKIEYDEKFHGCGTMCPPTFCEGDKYGHFCYRDGAYVCANSDADCYGLIGIFSSFIRDTCTNQVFYYGEIISENTQKYNQLITVQTENPDDWIYYGFGSIKIADLTKFVYFYHLSDYADETLIEKECFEGRGYPFLSGDVINNAKPPIPNLAVLKTPDVPTCPGETSCPWVICDNLQASYKCCAFGTCICSPYPDLCSEINQNTIIYTTATYNCDHSSGEQFYYGEFVTLSAMSLTITPFQSLKYVEGNYWIYRGYAIFYIRDRADIDLTQFVYFYHKFSTNSSKSLTGIVPEKLI